MASDLPDDQQPLASRSLSEELDAICDQFEAAWQMGQQPRIEDYLERAPEARQARLFEELLGIEIERRWRAGREPGAMPTLAVGMCWKGPPRRQLHTGDNGASSATPRGMPTCRRARASEEEMDTEEQHPSEGQGEDREAVEISHLKRREIQAPIAACLIRGLAKVMGRELLTFKAPTDSVAFSPDGKRLANGSRDGTIKIRDVATGREGLTFEGHTGRVFNVAFSPDGNRVASASRDSTIKIWDASTGQELLTLRGHPEWRGMQIDPVAFSPDGKRIAIRGARWSIKILDAEGTEHTPSAGASREIGER